MLRKKTELYHYTNVDSLLKIFSTGTLKFSRIDKVNDPYEKIPLQYDDLHKSVYISCFSNYIKESIPLWKIYTQRGLGVRVDLFFKENNIQNNIMDKNRTIVDFANKELEGICLEKGQVESGTYMMIKDLIYTDKSYQYECVFVEEDGITINLDDMGAYKSTIWEYEHETRLMLYLYDDKRQKDIDSSYLLVPINFEELDHIDIRFDPWMSDEMKHCIELGLKEYKEKWNIKINCRDSELRDRII